MHISPFGNIKPDWKQYRIYHARAFQVDTITTVVGRGLIL